MAEAKSFADKAVELLLRSLRTVFNERVVQAVEKLIVQTRENLIGQEVPFEPTLISTSDRMINTKSTLPWMLSNEEKTKMDFTSIDFASQNTLGVGSAESEEVDIEAMVNASKKALNFLQKQVRVQSTNLNSLAKTKKDELEQVRKERAIEKDRLREEALLAKSLGVPEIFIPEKPVEIAIEVPIKPEVIQVPPSSEVQFASEPSKQAKPAKLPRVVEPPKPPKNPKPPKVKRTYSAAEKRKAGQLVVVAVIATALLVLLPQIKSVFSSDKSSNSTKLTKEATPTPTTTQLETSFPTPTPTPTLTKAPSASPKPTKTKAVNSGLVTDSSRSAVIASLEKCALSTVYSPPGCPFEETAFIHGTSMYWTLSGVPKITLVSSKAEVLTLLVSGKAVAHVYYGEKLRDRDHPFSRTAIATPSDATYIIKWK